MCWRTLSTLNTLNVQKTLCIRPLCDGWFKSYAADFNVRGTLIAGGLQRPAGGDCLCVQNTQTAGEDRHMTQNGRCAKWEFSVKHRLFTQRNMNSLQFACQIARTADSTSFGARRTQPLTACPLHFRCSMVCLVVWYILKQLTPIFRSSNRLQNTRRVVAADKCTSGAVYAHCIDSHVKWELP